MQSVDSGQGDFEMRRKLICLALTVLALTLITSLHAGSANSAEGDEDCGTLKSTTEDNPPDEVDNFNAGDEVWVAGEGLRPDTDYVVFVVPDQDWVLDVTDFEQIIVTEATFLEIHTNSTGDFPPTMIWDYADPGKYDMIADCQDETIDTTEYTYDVYDALDDFEVEGTAGFFVIPGTQLGTIAVLLAGFASLLLKKRAP